MVLETALEPDPLVVLETADKPDPLVVLETADKPDPLVVPETADKPDLLVVPETADKPDLLVVHAVAQKPDLLVVHEVALTAQPSQQRSPFRAEVGSFSLEAAETPLDIFPSSSSTVFAPPPVPPRMTWSSGADEDEEEELHEDAGETFRLAQVKTTASAASLGLFAPAMVDPDSAAPPAERNSKEISLA